MKKSMMKKKFKISSHSRLCSSNGQSVRFVTESVGVQIPPQPFGLIFNPLSPPFRAIHLAFSSTVSKVFCGKESLELSFTLLNLVLWCNGNHSGLWPRRYRFDSCQDYFIQWINKFTLAQNGGHKLTCYCLQKKNSTPNQGYKRLKYPSSAKKVKGEPSDLKPFKKHHSPKSPAQRSGDAVGCRPIIAQFDSGSRDWGIYAPNIHNHRTPSNSDRQGLSLSVLLSYIYHWLYYNKPRLWFLQ